MEYIFEASYRTLVTWASKKSSVDQSKPEKYLVSDCKTNYMASSVQCPESSVQRPGFSDQSPASSVQKFRYAYFQDALFQYGV